MVRQNSYFSLNVILCGLFGRCCNSDWPNQFAIFLIAESTKELGACGSAVSQKSKHVGWLSSSYPCRLIIEIGLLQELLSIDLWSIHGPLKVFAPVSHLHQNDSRILVRSHSYRKISISYR